MVNTYVVRPATSWMSVLGGWIATIGAAALVAPAVAGTLGAMNIGSGDLALAVPVIVGIFFSYLIGGYIAGRMAGYRTSWHGMLTAFFSLFVLLVIALLAYGADRGLFSGLGVNKLTDIVPGANGLNIDSVGNALTLGALLGFLTAILGGWIGGLLAPSQVAEVAPYPAGRMAGPVPASATGGYRSTPERSVRREVRREHRPFIPAFGRKGGERAEEERGSEERRGTNQP